jgi:Predicted signal transduction protein with a C-terminal ATPase domain
MPFSLKLMALVCDAVIKWGDIMKNNNMWKTVPQIEQKQYGSIFLKNLSLLSCLIIVPMIVVAWVSIFSFQLFSQKEAEHYNSQSVAYTKNMVDDMVSDCLKQMNYMLSDSNISLFVISKKGTYKFYHNDMIYTQIQAQVNTKEYLESIYFFAEENEKLLSNYGEIMADRFFDLSWMDKYEKTQSPDSLQYSFRKGRNNHLLPINFLSFYKTLNYGNANKGVMVYNVNFNKFARLLLENKSEYDAGLCIFDENDNIVYDVFGEHIEYIDKNTLEAFKSGKEYVSTKNYILYKTPIRHTDWYFVSAVSTQMYQDRLHGMRNTMLIAIVCGACITILLTILISKRIFRPIKNIFSLMNQPMNLMDVKVTSREEAYILTSIGKTLKENEQISKELSERIKRLKKAQSVALQSQINPHFLNNTLDTINWSAMRLTGGKNDVSIMLAKLSKMFRYSLENSDNLVPFKVELEHCRTYLELEERRYKNKFAVEWDIDENTLLTRTIKIILQPILENAIQHGIKPMQENGIISISAQIQQDKLVISIQDNGMGMNLRTRTNLNESMKGDAIKENNNIGLRNVNQRIQLLFGEEYGLRILQGDKTGTKVSLSLPVIRDTETPPFPLRTWSG